MIPAHAEQLALGYVWGLEDAGRVDGVNPTAFAQYYAYLWRSYNQERRSIMNPVSVVYKEWMSDQGIRDAYTRNRDRAYRVLADFDDHPDWFGNAARELVRELGEEQIQAQIDRWPYRVAGDSFQFLAVARLAVDLARYSVYLGALDRFVR